MLRLPTSRRLLPYCWTGARLYHAGPDEFGHLPSAPEVQTSQLKTIGKEESQRVQLVNAYRRYGYLTADLDLLGLKKPPQVPELDARLYGLTGGEEEDGKLAEGLRHLYCGTVAIEFMHLNNPEERQWLAGEYEKAVTTELTADDRRHLCLLINRCENFDHFLALKFPTVKRYGSEGAEAMYGFFSEFFEASPAHGLEQLFIGIAHRGRLNLLNEMMHFPTVQMFRKMRGKTELPDEVQGAGDVLSHLVSSFDYSSRRMEGGGGGKVHVSMLPNPSHLEAVNPVAMGKARARARSLGRGDYATEKTGARPGDGVLCCLVHGDGAFSGQGIVWESLALSQAPHFRLGGTVHLVTNNQIAFTAETHLAGAGRSSRSCTDVAKAFDYPVLHVNGDAPDDVIRATRLAMDYRNRYRKDIFINLVCLRRWGHNELDDPTFTQPRMYRAVEERRQSLPEKYTQQLMAEGVLTEEQAREERDKHTRSLMEAFRAVDKSEPSVNHLNGLWTGYEQAPAAICRYDTGVDMDLLKYIGAASVAVPGDGSFSLHPHLKKMHCEPRVAKLKEDGPAAIDWATAEALAFGSLLLQGNDIRLSGQDVGRGTFSHRHVMLVDQETDSSHIPLNYLSPEQQNFLEVANNVLSEEAILGFEYGFSLDSPSRLCIWEAQFGDFFNGAQIIIDTFVASGESKWLTQSGLTLLLPHGFDGAGPEHSSCRVERFLQLCDSSEAQLRPDGENVNLRIVNPTTSAQYFHLLRRQQLPRYRKPLIVVAPKLLLRHPRAASQLADFAPGTFFREVLEDPTTGSSSQEQVERIIFVSGKFYLDVEKEAEKRGMRKGCAIVRLEQLCPFPAVALQDVAKLYPKAKDFVWAQEEPRNAGCWSFVRPRFLNALGMELRFAGRDELAWTATAVGEMHQAELQHIFKQIFE